MKTTAKQFTSFGNISLVQLMSEQASEFIFTPGGPEMKKGGLVITEANEGGVVGNLVAINNTGSYLLLTDADVLVGAKQNRIINKSLLLAPNSKTLIDVSCIERLRWKYNEKNFSNPGSSADHNLRKAKAASMSRMNKEGSEMTYGTQQEVWSHINSRIMEENFDAKTESYHDLAMHHFNTRAVEFPVCEPEAGCNGIAVMADGMVQCIDLFGSEEGYNYYFPLLRDSAFRTAINGEKTKSAEIHEAYFKVLDALDNLETAERKADDQYRGAGKLSMAEGESLIGFELSMNSQPVHFAVFMK